MKISIITATYNSTAHIVGCLASVNSQTYKNIEHIIVDGASTDNTLEMIKTTENRIAQLISEPDHGIYDALNKGLRLATGDVIGFLHADDMFASHGTIETIVQGFSLRQPAEEMSGIPGQRGEVPAQIDGVYGNLLFVDSKNTDKVIRTWQSKPFHPKNLRHGWTCPTTGWIPPHPTLFLRKEVYEKYGLFNTTFRIAGDYDFMLRVMTDPAMHLRYLPGWNTVRTGPARSDYPHAFGRSLPCEICTQTFHRASTGSLKGIVLKMLEDIRALRNNGFKYPLAILAAKKFRKLPQLLHREKPPPPGKPGYSSCEEEKFVVNILF